MKIIGVYNPTGNGWDGDRYELQDNGSWYSIVKTHQEGKDLKNQFGGYTCLHVGQPTYIQKKWKLLLARYSNGKIKRISFMNKGNI